MAQFPFSYVNRRGVPVIATTGVTVTANNVVFSFPNHAFAGSWFRGQVLVRIAQTIPTGTTGTLPILFETNSVTNPLTKANGAAVTVDDIAGTGIYLLYYDKQTDVLEIIQTA